MNGKNCLLPCAGILILWGPLEEGSPLRWSQIEGLWHGFPGLERPIGNSVWHSFWEVPPQPVWRSLYGQLPDLFCKQISLDLAVFGEDTGNFRENNIMFQWTLNSSSWGIYESYYVSHTFALMFWMERKSSSEIVTECNYSWSVTMLALSLLLKVRVQCLCDNWV